MKSYPLVSIVTPLFNNRDHLGECIASVLAQTYPNWDYTIVNNCSTDGSEEIARQYAARDPRIRVITNQTFLRAVPNHNLALRQISPDSKYCKIVFADDWISPECVEAMVAVAERNPSVGIVGAYGLQDGETMWQGLPPEREAYSGRDVCRRLLLDEVYVFGTSTSLLYRSHIVRNQEEFYNESNLHADMEACLVHLKTCDFGFVHEVLTFKRNRPESLGAVTEDLQTLIAGHLHNLVAHGSDFLTQDELDRCRTALKAKYYNLLAVSLLRGRRDKKFWDYHTRKLEEEGIIFSRARLTQALVARLWRALLNPRETREKLKQNKPSFHPAVHAGA